MLTLDKSLKTKFALVCTGLILASCISLLVSFLWFGDRFQLRQLEQTGTQARLVVDKDLQGKAQQLALALNTLPSLRELQTPATERDGQSIFAQLSLQAERFGLDMLLLASSNGEILTANHAGFERSYHNVQHLIQLASASEGSVFTHWGGTLYQVAIKPLGYPARQTLLAGIAIERKDALQLKQLTGLDVSFIDQQSRAMVSSIVQTPSAETLLVPIQQSSFLDWAHRDASRLELTSKLLPGNQIELKLSANEPRAYRNFDNLTRITLGVTSAVVLLGLLAATWLAKTLTKSLSQLVASAHHFARGHYVLDRAPHNASLEIQSLFDAFSNMAHEMQAREQEARIQAQHDLLTQLFNRNTMLLMIEQHLQAEQRVLLIAINLHNFKNINDSLGPQMGDQCLQIIANRLDSSRYLPHMVHARLGGDEFLSLLPLDEYMNPQTVASEFIDSILMPVNVEGLTLHLRFSAGVTECPKDGDEAKTLMRRTIIALERARKENTGIAWYREGEDEAHLERLSALEDLKRALSGDNDQLYMNYQPKLDLKTGAIEKVECLIRWQRPSHGLVPPEYFIGLAEQSGIICDVTRWVINTVLQQLAQWQTQGIVMRAAINVSSQDISDPKFVPFLRSQLTHYQVQPECITLELTERDLMDNEQNATAILNELRSMGFTIAVDDYGIGQSSLGKLKQLPVTELKIDKSFVLQLDQSPTDQMIVQSTITLGHNLGLTVVAEGVENRASLDMLRKMHCDQIQGYFLSKPLTAEALTQWLLQDCRDDVTAPSNASSPIRFRWSQSH